MSRQSNVRREKQINETMQALERVIKDGWEIDYHLENNDKGDYALFMSQIRDAVDGALPGKMSASTADLLGFNDPVLGAKLKAESEMRDRVEEKLRTKPGNTPEWDITIEALVKAEKENGWDIETFWDWNEHDDQKYEKLRFGDLVKKPVLLISWLPKAFEVNTSQTYDEQLEAAGYK